MLGIFITLLTFVLILVSFFLLLVVLMQRANTQGGLGAAFGGGMADSTFGAETNNVLTKATKWSATAFFLLCAALYLMHIAAHSAREAAGEGETLPDIVPTLSSEPEAAPLNLEAIPLPQGAETPEG